MLLYFLTARKLNYTADLIHRLQTTDQKLDSNNNNNNKMSYFLVKSYKINRCNLSSSVSKQLPLMVFCDIIILKLKPI